MRENKIMPTTWLLLAILAMAAAHFLFPWRKIVPSPWNLLGLLPLALGAAFNLIADGAFHKGNTTVRPFEESSALITLGIFRVTRNPMYLGFVLILSGIAILTGSITPWAVIPAFIGLIDRMYIRVEERMLARKFGPRWEEYRKHVRRWI